MIGQRRLLARLGERALEGDVAHAYELSGPRSIGKRTVATRLAQTLLCTSEPRVAGGCGTCLACRKVEHATHPDVRLVTRRVDLDPGGDKKMISIEQVREMQQDLALRPLEGRWRIVIVDDAADLSEHAEVKDAHVLGLDVGTSGVKAVLVSIGGDVVASSTTPLTLSTPRPGWAEQDPDAWWGASVASPNPSSTAWSRVA